MLARRPLSVSTRAKHLRVLNACLGAAVAHGFAARNVIGALPKSEKPRATKKESAFFEQAELPKVFAQVPEGVSRVISEVALETGAPGGRADRVDVDPSGVVLHVRRAHTDGYTHEPKNHEKRDVDLAGDVVALLGAWWRLGKPGDGTLVFPGRRRRASWTRRRGAAS